MKKIFIIISLLCGTFFFYHCSIVNPTNPETQGNVFLYHFQRTFLLIDPVTAKKTWIVNDDISNHATWSIKKGTKFEMQSDNKNFSIANSDESSAEVLKYIYVQDDNGSRIYEMRQFSKDDTNGTSQGCVKMEFRKDEIWMSDVKPDINSVSPLKADGLFAKKK